MRLIGLLGLRYIACGDTQATAEDSVLKAFNPQQFAEVPTGVTKRPIFRVQATASGLRYIACGDTQATAEVSVLARHLSLNSSLRCP